MGQLSRAQTIGIVALLTVVTGWVGVTVLQTGSPLSPSTPGIVVREAPPASDAGSSSPPSSGSRPQPSVPASSASAVPPASTDTPVTEIVVHVAGAVKKPGVYRLPPGARNDDAVHAAGGFTSAANPDAVNLAAHSEDGSQLYIPTRAEHPSGGDTAHDSASASVSTVESSGSASHPSNAGSSGKSSRSSNKFSDPSQGRVNLNTADAAQLQHIPGIGPAMAERILAYRRTAGRIQSPDELLQISGIGDKKYQKMKPYMTVR